MNEMEKRIEAVLRRAVQPVHGSPIAPNLIPPKRKPDPGDTYFGRSQMEMGIDPLAGAYLVGSEAGVSGPFAPSPIQWDTGNIEPPLGIDITTVPDETTVAHGGSVLLPQAEESESELNPMENDNEP